MAVGVVERGGDLRGETHGVGNRELFFAVEPIAERFPVHERHDVVGGAVHLARINQSENVGMLQRRDGLDLAEEPFGPDHRGQLRPEHLDRHPAVVLEVLGEVHRGHAARAQLPLDGVAVGQRGGESRAGVAHRASRAFNSTSQFSTTMSGLPREGPRSTAWAMMNRPSGPTSHGV